MSTSTLCLNWTTQQAACACCERKNICSIFTKLCFYESPTFNTNHSFEWFIFIFVFTLCLNYICTVFRRTQFFPTVILIDNFLYVKIIHILFSTNFVNRLCFILTPPSFASQNPPPPCTTSGGYYFL